MDARTVIVNSLGCTYGKADWLISDLEAAGFAIVPKQPTESMIDAGVRAEFGGTLGSRVTNAWSDMIAAAKKETV